VHPLLGGWVAFLEEAPAGRPQVLQYVNQIDDDRDLGLALAGLGLDPVDLVVVGKRRDKPAWSRR